MLRLFIFDLVLLLQDPLDCSDPSKKTRTDDWADLSNLRKPLMGVLDDLKVSVLCKLFSQVSIL